MIKNELIQLIKDQRARVGVIGLGYVGLPLAEHTRLRPHEIDRRVDEYLAMVRMLQSKRVAQPKRKHGNIPL